MRITRRPKTVESRLTSAAYMRQKGFVMHSIDELIRLGGLVEAIGFGYIADSAYESASERGVVVIEDQSATLKASLIDDLWVVDGEVHVDHFDGRHDYLKFVVREGDKLEIGEAVEGGMPLGASHPSGACDCRMTVTDRFYLFPCGNVSPI